MVPETNDITIGVLLLLSFALGLKHAIEPDHLAAVSTIVSERKSIHSACLVGGLWGLGHTFSLLAAGILVIGLQVKISGRLAGALEFGVALMLIVLGLDTLRKVLGGGKIHWHVHRHGGVTHAHPHVHGAAEAHSHSVSGGTHHGVKLSPKPLIVGMIHGMAGSGTLMLLVLATISSPTVGIAYILVFGVGSVGGMMVMSTLIGLPFHFATKYFSGADRLLRCAAGIISLGLGVSLAIEISPFAS